MISPAPADGPVSGSSSPAGTIPLAPGLTAHYVYHYDRNALAGALIAGDAIIAMTDSGNLLRFDRATLKLAKEWFGPTAATCLGRGGDGDLLVGFADGRIARVAPADLTVTDLAWVSGRVQWVGSIASGPGRPTKPRL